MIPIFQRLAPVTISTEALARDFDFWFELTGQAQRINVYRRGLHVYGVEDFEYLLENRLKLVFTMLLVESDDVADLLVIQHFGSSASIGPLSAQQQIREQFQHLGFTLK